MEKFLNHYDKECMKMAMLKHEETFREQVFELHRLYRIQKTLMKDVARNQRAHPQRRNACCEPEARAPEAFSFPESGGKRRVVSGIEDDQSDLELTLGPRSYYQKKIKAAEPGPRSDSGTSLASSSTGSRQMKKGARSTAKGEFWSQQKWGPEMPALSNQDRLNGPNWLFSGPELEYDMIRQKKKDHSE